MTIQEHKKPFSRSQNMVAVKDKEGLRKAVRSYAVANDIGIGDVYVMCGRYKAVEYQILNGRIAPSTARALKELGIDVDKYINGEPQESTMFAVYGTKWLGTCSHRGKQIARTEVKIAIHNAGVNGDESRYCVAVAFNKGTVDRITMGNRLAWGISETSEGTYMVFSDTTEGGLKIVRSKDRAVIKKHIDALEANELTQFVGDYELQTHPVLGYCIKIGKE